MSRIIWLAPYPEIVDFFFLKCWFCFMCFNVGVFCNATALSYPLLSLGLVRLPGAMWICRAAQSRVVPSSDTDFFSNVILVFIEMN